MDQDPFGPIVDCDVHQELRSADDELLPYLSAGWQEHILSFRRAGSGSEMITYPAVRQYASHPHGALRHDAIPDDGSPAGSSLALMIEQLLDPFDVQYAILTGGGLLGVAGHTNPYFGAEIARAFNDHQVEHWLDQDARLRGSISLAMQVPDWAAAEIRRWQDEPRMVQAMACTNPQAHAFGHPIYDPVHKACAETGRPFAIHTFGDGVAGAMAPALASGSPSTYLEFRLTAFQGLISHLMSFIAHGVFDRYPDFRLVLVEGGVTWVPAFINRMDSEFKALRREVPWCKRLPSQYLQDQIMVTTQPFELSGRADPLIPVMTQFGMDDVLAFSSDYPHWDTDLPTYAISLLPQSWRRKVMSGNAQRMYGLPLAAPAYEAK